MVERTADARGLVSRNAILKVQQERRKSRLTRRQRQTFDAMREQPVGVTVQACVRHGALGGTGFGESNFLSI